MTIKRLILSLLTLAIIFLAGSTLVASWQQPQIQSRLELYQTNLLLRAQVLPSENADPNLTKASKTLLGENPLGAATKQYLDAQKSAQQNLDKAETQLALIKQNPKNVPALPKTDSQIAPITDHSPSSQQAQLLKSVANLFIYQSLDKAQRICFFSKWRTCLGYALGLGNYLASIYSWLFLDGTDNCPVNILNFAN